MRPSNCTLDVTRIAPGLYQGSFPLPGRGVRRCGFHTLVLSARELQPPDSAYPGVRVVRALIDDSGPPPTQREWDEAMSAAQAASLSVARGERALVTCAKGRNRSGLVMALTLYLLTGRPGHEILDHIRLKRKGSFTNPYFAHAVRGLP